MALTPRELAAQRFSKGDRVRDRSGRTGTVYDVKVYAAAVVSVSYDDDRMRLLPALYFTLTNLTRQTD